MMPAAIGSEKSRIQFCGFLNLGESAQPAELSPLISLATSQLRWEKVARGLESMIFLGVPVSWICSTVKSRIATFLSAQSPPAIDLGKCSIRSERCFFPSVRAGNSKVSVQVSRSGRLPVAKMMWSSCCFKTTSASEVDSTSFRFCQSGVLVNCCFHWESLLSKSAGRPLSSLLANVTMSC